MLKSIKLDEAIEIIKSNYSNTGLTVLVLWSTEKEPMTKKIKLLNNTFGSQFKLITKHADRGVMGIRNDILSIQKKGKKVISFICVPESSVSLCEQEITNDPASYTYIIE